MVALLKKIIRVADQWQTLIFIFNSLLRNFRNSSVMKVFDYSILITKHSTKPFIYIFLVTQHAYPIAQRRNLIAHLIAEHRNLKYTYEMAYNIIDKSYCLCVGIKLNFLIVCFYSILLSAITIQKEAELIYFSKKNLSIYSEVPYMDLRQLQ